MTPEEIAGPQAQHPRGELERRYGVWGIGPVSFALIVISVAVALYSDLGNKQDALGPLFISEDPIAASRLIEVRHGELWRLITPAFIHFGALHIVFNMMWVKDLGTAIERRHGAGFLLALFAVLAVGSNLTQYFLVGPFFGGMSGVVYGWFGYVWLRGYFDPASGYRVPAKLAAWMIGWLVVCQLGLVGPVANAAHLAGLGLGAAIGAALAFRARKNLQPS